jgi:hypothetical protein
MMNAFSRIIEVLVFMPKNPIEEQRPTPSQPMKKN